MIKTVIFDIHGTIADCNHRLHFINNPIKQDFESFYKECVNDLPIHRVISLIPVFSRNHRVVFITAAPESSRDLIGEWIDKHIRPYDYDAVHYDLFMRADSDTRPDWIVKRDIFEKEGLNPSNVLCIFEDRAKNVKYFRDLGFTVLQVADGDY